MALFSGVRIKTLLQVCSECNVCLAYVLTVCVIEKLVSSKLLFWRCLCVRVHVFVLCHVSFQVHNSLGECMSLPCFPFN